MKALLIVVVLSLSLMVVGCQKSVTASVKPTVKIDTVYVKNDSLAIHQNYLDYCVKKNCDRTDACCEAIDNLADGQHSTDCPIYKTWLKRISKKSK